MRYRGAQLGELGGEKNSIQMSQKNVEPKEKTCTEAGMGYSQTNETMTTCSVCCKPHTGDVIDKHRNLLVPLIFTNKQENLLDQFVSFNDSVFE